MKRARSWAAWALVAAAAAAVPLVQRRIDAHAAGGDHDPMLYVWSGRQVRRLLPGFEQVAADIYWIRTVQYFGGQRVFSKNHNFELLEPLTDITVTLDPRLEIAYRYGAVFLAEPVGAGRPRSAVALLERGVRANPQNWRLRKELGYFKFVFLGDAQTAATHLIAASKLPDAPLWLRTMAADVLGRGGDRATARRMWRQMYEQEEWDVLKQNALIHLQILDALDGRDLLQRVVDEFSGRFGHHPASLAALVPAGYVSRVPDDPSGTPFAYDPATGRVTLARGSPLWRPDQ